MNIEAEAATEAIFKGTVKRAIKRRPLLKGWETKIDIISDTPSEDAGHTVIYTWTPGEGGKAGRGCFRLYDRAGLAKTEAIMERIRFAA